MLSILARGEAMPPPPAASSLGAPAAADRALAHHIFKELIEVDTSQSNGDTTRAAEMVAKRLRHAGWPAADIQVVGPSPKRKNLVARLHGIGARRPLLLLAHLDVVDAHRSDWTVEPFKLLERDGYFYGRGTQDDKSLAALWIATVLRLQREAAQRPLDRDVILALTADEEAGPENGVHWLLANRRGLIDSELALTEGGAGELHNGQRLSIDVQPTEKGYLTFVLEAKNRGGHSSLPEPDNAIVRVADAVGRIHRHAFPVELNDVTRDFFARMADIERGPLAADMRAVARPRPDAAAAARLSRVPLYNARLRTTCVPTMMQAGHAENALPQLARVTINCRILPGHGGDEVRQELARVIADPALELTAARDLDPSPPSPLPHDLVAVIERAGAAVWPGVPVLPIMLTGATDGRHLHAAGIPTYGVTGLFVDIDDIRAHGRDERLAITSFYDAQDFLYRVVAGLVGAE